MSSVVCGTLCGVCDQYVVNDMFCSEIETVPETVKKQMDYGDDRRQKAARLMKGLL